MGVQHQLEDNMLIESVTVTPTAGSTNISALNRQSEFDVKKLTDLIWDGSTVTNDPPDAESTQKLYNQMAMFVMLSKRGGSSPNYKYGTFYTPSPEPFKDFEMTDVRNFTGILDQRTETPNFYLGVQPTGLALGSMKYGLDFTQSATNPVTANMGAPAEANRQQTWSTDTASEIGSYIKDHLSNTKDLREVNVATRNTFLFNGHMNSHTRQLPKTYIAVSRPSTVDGSQGQAITLSLVVNTKIEISMSRDDTYLGPGALATDTISYKDANNDAQTATVPWQLPTVHSGLKRMMKTGTQGLSSVVTFGGFPVPTPKPWQK